MEAGKVTNNNGYRNLGVVNIQMGNYSDAKSYLKKALLIKKDGEAYFQYGNACFLNDEPQEGLQYYNMALSSGYDGAEALFLIGKAYEDMNDYVMALRFYQKAVIKNPICSEYQIKKINILLHMNKIEEAEKAASILLETNSELYEAYHIKTLILHSLHKTDEAKALSKLASEKFPEDVGLLIDYVTSLAMAEEHELAQKVLVKARRTKYYEHYLPQLMLLEIEIHIEKGDTDSALKLCDECISSFNEIEDVTKAKFLKMNLSVTKQDYETALKIAEDLSQQEENKAIYFASIYYRGFCVKQLGRIEEATGMLKEAVSIYKMWTLVHPGAIDVYMYRAMCLKELGEYEDALKQVEFIEGVNDTIAEIHILKAEIYKQTNRNHLVNIELEKARLINSNFEGKMLKEI